MFNEAKELRGFYETNLGQMAGHLIRRKIRAIWPNVSGMTLVGLGFTNPYLRPFLNEAGNVFSFMPAQQGALNWPNKGKNIVALVDEGELPLQDVSVDRVLRVPALESTEQLRGMLQEVWRILTGNGRLLIVVPNRRGLWARFDRTPFGHGHPYSPVQLQNLLQANMFSAVQSTNALYLPPYQWPIMLRSAFGIEDIGFRWFKHLSGVIIVEMKIEIYGVTRPVVFRSRTRRLIPVSSSRIPVAQVNSVLEKIIAD